MGFWSRTNVFPRGTLLALGAAGLLAASGCGVAEIVGGMADSAHRSGSHKVAAEYAGLRDKSFAVIVSADRSVQADYPALVPELINRITTRLRENAGAAGSSDPQQLVRWLFNNPGWAARSPGTLARQLGVERLIYIDLGEFRLRDPGNAYLWAGVAAGRVSVLEAEAEFGDAFVFEHEIMVRFPDGQGFGPDDMGGAQVASVIVSRFVDRASWLFYEHEEKNVMEY
jgi:hypothetical protein